MSRLSYDATYDRADDDPRNLELPPGLEEYHAALDAAAAERAAERAASEREIDALLAPVRARLIEQAEQIRFTEYLLAQERSR